MSDGSELDTLLIRNLLDLDDAAKRIDALSDQVWTEISATAKAWVSETDGWSGTFEDIGFQLGPESWKSEQQFDAWFYIDFGPGHDAPDQSRYFDLTHYVGAGGAQLCLWFDCRVPRKAYKLASSAFAMQLSNAGFSLSDAGNFYIPCTLDPETVAQALNDQSLKSAMEPIRAALERARAATPIFDDLLTASGKK